MSSDYCGLGVSGVELRIKCGFVFFWGGGGLMSMAFAATWHRFWVQLGWLVLGPFGVPGAEECILCFCLHCLAPLGYQGMRHGLFWYYIGTCWGFPCAFVSDVFRELLIGLCSVLLSYFLTTAVSGVVCWRQTDFNTGTYQAHSAFFLSVEVVGHYSVAIIIRRSTHRFFCI